MKFLKKLIKIFFYLTLFFFIWTGTQAFTLGLQYYFQISENPQEEKTAAIVFGARVYNDGRLSPVTQDRVDTAFDLYQGKKVKKILVSGDHGTKEYDEVNAMRKYLLDRGVKEEDLFMDHAGFDTYDTIYRARDVFEVKDTYLVTQKFHLPRALYIADNLGITALGVPADKRKYRAAINYAIRERLARVKAVFNVFFHSKPKFLGEVISIDGDGRKSWD